MRNQKSSNSFFLFLLNFPAFSPLSRFCFPAISRSLRDRKRTLPLVLFCFFYFKAKGCLIFAAASGEREWGANVADGILKRLMEQEVS